ncbi:Lysine--tRNA ligase, cytoplasmic [Lecanosticta acicola]|uniref:Lysyl-tRNA synthetase n=1 Tax=Lecanosticta acicola TaxID=111012 RepID=A0AAI8YP75_9PEZI|nr:Lysine--tRNA ligase, cytoplasmic [Lecanosticta acicola]
MRVRRLRPYLFNGFKRFQRVCPTRPFASFPSLCAADERRDVTHDYEKRVAQLRAHKSLAGCYPRLPEAFTKKLSSRAFLDSSFEGMKPGDTDTSGHVRMAGRVRSVRTAGSKLLFIDIQNEEGTLQTVCQLSKLQEQDDSVTPEAFKAFSKIIRKGDHFAVVGHVHRTERGENSLLAVALPQLLSPSLHQIPERLEDREARARSRHVNMLVNPDAIRTLRVRHEVEACLQAFFNDEGFIKVTTPVLGAGAGGAAARPFETEATELADQKLNLRIAPELWLKRLIVGGMDKIYEIGPAFRNEGVDATHNPEFNICEFYQAYATLQDLMNTTITIIEDLRHRFTWLQGSGALTDLPELEILGKDFEQVEFIPGLEERLDCYLPDLQAADAHDKILKIFDDKQIPTPSNPTLPRLLDELSAKYLEPLSDKNPIFITNHPACMSPLSKHFVCPKTSQFVAARAELFIAGREYANMYEEENSPFEQRKKFEEQMRQREVDKEAMELDEGYLRALEWGLPPTGGWGCGIDRLVMLFSGRERMADVLAFGSLRNVVGLGKTT